MTQKCSLILSNGMQFDGQLIGAPVSVSGELVFTTGMVAYSEAITDPSYFGQILTFTYPLIGNYGIPTLNKDEAYPLPKGFESTVPWAAAVIITIDSPEAFHWNSCQSIHSWLSESGVPGIIGIDTRHLVHLIRSTPNLLGRIVPQSPIGERYKNSLLSFPHDAFFDPGLNNILADVSNSEVITQGEYNNITIAVIDCGIKWNIVRQLVDLGCRVEILPWDTELTQVKCDAWLVSNGPGDPTNTGDLITRIEWLLTQDKPLLGICLGHQLISLAAGAKTCRMPYGHRSHNQPVYEVGTRNGYITTQNHGYIVEENSIPEDWEPWFKNVNDQSIEGVRHKSKPFKSVQFHPEASGGPRDTGWILEQFVCEVKNYAHS